jgi:hypothetical protein
LLTLEIPFDEVLENVALPDAPPAFHFTLGYYDYPLPRVIPPARNQVFDRIAFSPGTVGQTFTENAQSDPDFTAFVADLTNGLDNGIARSFFQVSPDVVDLRPSGIIEGESYYLRAATGGNKDLIGNTITSLSARLNSLSFSQVDPQGPGIPGTRYTGTFTVTVEGVPLPEPGAVPLFVALALLVATLRRRTNF